MVALSEVWGKGSEGGQRTGRRSGALSEGNTAKLQFSYDTEASIMDKINAVVTKVYHGAGVDYAPAAKKEIKRLEELGYDKLPICMAKTQYSFSDTPTLLGAPEDFRITISKVKVSAGAGFVVVYTGDIMTMPGLPKVPSAEKIDVDNDGKISGLILICEKKIVQNKIRQEQNQFGNVPALLCCLPFSFVLVSPHEWCRHPVC